MHQGQAKIAAFLYHDVTDDPSESGFQRPSAMRYKQTREAFASHLDGIASGGHTPKIVSQLNFRRPGKHVLITFDDGGKGALHAAEELNRRGWKGHFFITTDLLGNRTFLDANQLRYLQSCGHEIGSHSHTHPDIFKGIPYEQMIREWRMSCDLLSDLLGRECVTGSVPGGDASRRVFQSAHETGMKYLFTSDPFLVPREEGDCWILGRVCPKTDAPRPHIQKLAGFRGWRKALFFRRAKTAVKTTFFPLYRTYIRLAYRHQ
ncbi:MAG TPA: polysaccharide deacetylase family protein [Verrucomicrobiae bacterium]|nr:polysaccharide deacetylase family protein [Verrucomicrobiae bacterium]